ncbi:MAG: dihydropyrimidinase [Clostridiales bacterium]|jgi:dihydropyrimidinase|nr:dihydropyrimidinase [Clostridiales bacterium]MDN5282097.1 dihydropyrimidinase [Candidatus Ozemobacter sp.]
MFDMVLKNGNVFIDNQFNAMDLAIKGNKIACLGENLQGEKEIDVAGLWVLPGAIDAHTHFSLPFAGKVSADDFFTGTRAAAIGGVTTIIDFLAQQGDEGVLESFERRKKLAEGAAVIDYSFHACIGRYSSEVISQMRQLADYGLTSLKVFMAYGKTGLMQSDHALMKIMRDCAEQGILLTVHAENGLLIDALVEEAEKSGKLDIEALKSTRPLITEVEAIERLALFARETGCKTYVVHTSSGAGAEVIRRHRAMATPIAAETCPQYLYLDNSMLSGQTGHYFSCCPPIREKTQQNKLWECLEDGSLSVVATDHCPFKKSEKDSGKNNILNLPMGLPGIETLPLLVLNGALNHKISIEKAIRSISENPARIFGLYPEKGSLIPGTDADIMVFDPQRKWKISNESLSMATDYSPYENLEITGKNTLTIFGGDVIYSEKSGWKGLQGRGRFLKRKKTDQSFFSF